MSDNTAVQGLIEAIDDVKEKRAQITVQIDDVDSLSEQVKTSAEQAMKHLHQQFTELRHSLNAVLSEREAELEKEVHEAMGLDLCALAEIQDELQENLTSTVDFMGKGKKLLMDDHDTHTEEMKTFAKDVKATNFQSEMVIPTAQDVACFHIEIPSGLVEEVERQLKDFGEVFTRPPVQISSVEARPGGLMVKWSETEEDALELDEFYLQYCQGNALGNDDEDVVFKEAYKGCASCTLVRPLQHGVAYSLRVCGRTSGAPTWSPWSVPLSVSTTLPHYKWSSSLIDTTSQLSHEDRVYEKLTDQKAESPWLSDGPCLQCGHSLTFKVHQCGMIDGSDCVFLSRDSVTSAISLTDNECLLVTAQGKIYVQGEEKTIKFPPLTRNSVVSFDTESIGPSKVRVNIEVDDKYTAGFDWSLEKCSSRPESANLGDIPLEPTVNDSEKRTFLYFGAQFVHSGWKVEIE